MFLKRIIFIATIGFVIVCGSFVSAKAETLRQLPKDDGVMMSMGLLAANSGISAAKERMAANIKRKYGLSYEGSTVTYNDEQDRLVFQGNFSDKNAPMVFNKAMCSTFIDEARGNVNRTLDNKEAINAFLSTYYIMAGGARQVDAEMLKNKIRERMIIAANVSLHSESKNAVCSGTVNGSNVYYKVK